MEFHIERHMACSAVALDAKMEEAFQGAALQLSGTLSCISCCCPKAQIVHDPRS